MAQEFEAITGNKYHVQDSGKGYVQLNWRTGAEVHETDARNVVEAVAALNGKQSRPLLVRMQSMRKVDRKARKQFIHAASVSKVALIVATPLSRTVGSFLIGLDRNPSYPTRLFTEEAEAIAWLLADE